MLNRPIEMINSLVNSVISSVSKNIATADPLTVVTFGTIQKICLLMGNFLSTSLFHSL